jgi:hypothetical protein
MDSATESKSQHQAKNPRRPKRPAIVSQLTRAGYTIDRVIMPPDGSTEFVVAGGGSSVEEPNSWDEVMGDGAA